MADLQGQVALVTGASRGIGRAIAVALARAGALVYLGARTTTDLDRAVAEIGDDGGRAVALELDVTRPDSIAAGVARIASGTGIGDQVEDGRRWSGPALARLDLAVLNAGVLPPRSPIEDTTPDQWRACFDVNLFGVVDCARAVVPLLRPGGGRIIVVGSGTGREANPGLGVYGASKAALTSFVQTLAMELRDDAIAVNELIPGPVATSMLSPDGLRSSLADPGGEWFKQPEDVTDLALFLARCPTDGPTGQTFSLARRPLR